MKRNGLVLLIVLLLLVNTAYANFITYHALVYNVEIQDIDEEIKSIWLVIYDKNCNVADAYKNSDMDFSNVIRYLEAYPNEENKYCAIFESEVDPYEKEDIIFNDNYDKKNFVVKYHNNYSYTVDGPVRYSFGEEEKYSSREELIDYYLRYWAFDDSLDEKALSTKDISCTRTTFYSAKRLIELIEIPVSQIKNNNLKYKITDTSALEEAIKNDPNAGWAIRFENSDGEYKTFMIGNHDVDQNSRIMFKSDSQKLEKSLVVDYSTEQVLESGSNFKDLLNQSILSALIKAALIITLIMTILTLVIILIVKALKKDKHIPMIIIVNVIIAITLILLYYCFVKGNVIIG